MNVIIKPGWLLLENEVQDEIGHHEFGTYAALFSLGFLFIALSDLGLNQYTTKKLAGEPEKLKEIFPSLLTIKILVSAVYPVIMAGVGYVLGYEGEEIYFLVILSLTQAVLQTLMFVRANFQARQSFRTDSFISISDKVFLAVIVLILMINRISLEEYIYARLIASVVALVIFYLVLMKVYGWIRPGINPKTIRKILRFSIPFAVLTVLYSLNEKVDQVMLERIGDSEISRIRTGLYAASYRWLDAFMMYLWTILPIFFARFAFLERRPEELKRYFDFGQIVSCLPMVFVSVFVFFYAEKLFWLFDNSSEDQVEIMADTAKILFLSALVQGFFAIYSTYLTSTGSESFVSKMIVISTAINIILNLIFIPEYGTYAAAWSTFISTAFLSLTYVVYIHLNKRLNISWKLLSKLAVVSALFSLVFWFLSGSSLPWYTITLLSGGILLVMSWFGGLIQILYKGN